MPPNAFLRSGAKLLYDCPHFGEFFFVVHIFGQLFSFEGGAEVFDIVYLLGVDKSIEV